MPSAQLSRDNDYKFPPAPSEALLDRATWDAVMGSEEPGNEGLAPRLRALEAKRTELQAIIDDLRLFGLQRLDTAIVPLIDETKEQIQTLQNAVAQIIEQNGQVIEDFQVQIAAALQSLNDDLAALQTQIDLILAGGIPADNVAESNTRVFVTPAQRSEIEELRTDLEALLQSLDQTFQSIGQSIAAKQSTSEKNQPNGYAGLNGAGKLAEKQIPPAIKVVRQVFLSSGVFQKEPDDLWYFVEVLNGGDGGSGGNAVFYSTTSADGAAGGNSGSYASETFYPDDLPASIDVTIGAGGNGGLGRLVDNRAQVRALTAPTPGGRSYFGAFSAPASTLANGGVAGTSGSVDGKNGSPRMNYASNPVAVEVGGITYTIGGGGGSGRAATTTGTPGLGSGTGGDAGQSSYVSEGTGKAVATHGTDAKGPGGGGGAGGAAVQANNFSSNDAEGGDGGKGGAGIVVVRRFKGLGSS